MRDLWPALRFVGGVLVLGLLVWRFGTGPIADAWRVTTWGSIALALVLTALATLANAWRWRVVSRALGIPLTPLGSVAAYYRSQFLNSVLPGGVLGDAHRGALQGRGAGDLGAGLRATVWDRVSGQVIQAALVVLTLALLPTPLRGYTPAALAGLAAVAVLAWWLARRDGVLAFVGRDLGTLGRSAVVTRVALASCASTAAHVAVFAVAVRSVGLALPFDQVVVLALVVLVGSAIPLNVAGWGPREGVTAAVFVLAGQSSADGLTVSIVFGVLSTVATLPGVLVLLADVVVRRRRPPVGRRSEARTRPLEEARRG
jgi:glycosyltransferase 2 family protein